PAGAGESDWTAVTLARDGSWGTATDPSQAVAIAAAIGNCKSMSLAANDCGSLLSTIRGGLGLPRKYRHHNNFFAGPTLVEAEQAALYREIDLQMFYVPDLPPCLRVLAVDPAGRIVHPSEFSLTFPAAPGASSPGDELSGPPRPRASKTRQGYEPAPTP